MPATISKASVRPLRWHRVEYTRPGAMPILRWFSEQGRGRQRITLFEIMQLSRDDSFILRRTYRGDRSTEHRTLATAQRIAQHEWYNFIHQACV